MLWADNTNYGKIDLLFLRKSEGQIMQGKLMLIDGNSILNRAFYGLQNNLLKTAEGLYTNGVYGFLNILSKYLEEENPDYLAVAFDLKDPTFRHQAYDKYKGTRKGMPPELVVQVPLIKEVLDAMNITRMELKGYEADDIIGTYAKKAESLGVSCIIITGDRDSLQLVSPLITVKLPVTRAGKTTTEFYDTSAILEKYGVEPVKLIDVKALMGDTSDNIPGVPGIGEKTALDLIKTFDSLDNIYENIDNVQKESVKSKLKVNKELAYMSKMLAEICKTVPLSKSIEEIKRVDVNNKKLKEIFLRLEFRSMIERYKLNIEPIETKTFDTVNNDLININSAQELTDMVDKLLKLDKLYIDCLWDKQKLFEIKLYSDSGLAYKIDLLMQLVDEDVVKTLKPLFENESIGKVCFNVKPFVLWLKEFDCKFKGLIFDAAVASYIVDSTRQANTIGDVYRFFTGDEITDTGEALKRILPAALAKLEENGQMPLFNDIELPLIEVLADFEYIGFKVDSNILHELGASLEIKINELMNNIFALSGRSFNINSPKQLGEVLFDELKLPAKKKTKTGYSTGQEVLESLLDQHPIISLIMEYRQSTKLKSTYIDGLLSVVNPKTGRVHSSFNQLITATGRLSSTEPNLQNIPIRHELGKQIRKAFIPADENHVLVDADYSQIELRVLAHIAQDSFMQQAFKDNLDIHAITASQVNGVDLSEVTSVMRSRAKAVNFGIVYGISDFGLSRDLGISRKEAKIYIDSYLDRYVGVKNYMHEIVEVGTAQGYVTTLFGRRRYLNELSSSNHNIRSFAQRMAMNTPIQGTAADIIKIAMIKVHNALEERGLKSKLILQVHDELLVDTLISELDEVKSIVKYCMEDAVILSVPMKVDVFSGKDWYHAKQ